MEDHTELVQHKACFWGVHALDDAQVHFPDELGVKITKSPLSTSRFCLVVSTDLPRCGETTEWLRCRRCLGWRPVCLISTARPGAVRVSLVTGDESEIQETEAPSAGVHGKARLSCSGRPAPLCQRASCAAYCPHPVCYLKAASFWSRRTMASLLP